MRRSPLLLQDLLAAVCAVSCPAATLDAAQHDALLAIYNATSGPDWTHSEHWLEPDVSECVWFGVTCDATNTQVVSIALGGNGLAGAFPDVLVAFPALVSVFLYANRLSGPLPSLSGLAHFDAFVAFENKFPCLSADDNVGPWTLAKGL